MKRTDRTWLLRIFREFVLTIKVERFADTTKNKTKNSHHGHSNGVGMTRAVGSGARRAMVSCAGAQPELQHGGIPTKRALFRGILL